MKITFWNNFTKYFAKRLKKNYVFLTIVVKSTFQIFSATNKKIKLFVYMPKNLIKYFV